MRTVLIGDSHLARLGNDLSPLVATPVFNAAEAGAFIGDALRQASAKQVGANDVVVLSIGTNDAAPWKQTPFEAFSDGLGQLKDSFDLRRWIYLTPPGVDESRLSGSRNRTNLVTGIYRDEAITVLRSGGAAILLSHKVIAELGGLAFSTDGVHLTEAAYSLLLPEIANRIASVMDWDP
jgi:lysophospholipase L1-like esterase